MEKVPLKGNHSNMSPEEIDSWYAKIEEAHRTHLSQYGVRLPRKGSAMALWLIFLAKHKGKLVHKDTISAFVNAVNPAAGKDQQVRHAAAAGWNVLNRSENAPDDKAIIPSGYHVLLSLETPKPDFLHKALKRAGRISAKNFDQLKIVYDLRCATCGSQEGKPNFQNTSKRTVLHQGHKDPSKALSLENSIPQCDICNQAYQDDFVFDDKGRIVAVASTRPVQRASKAVQEKIKKSL